MSAGMWAQAYLHASIYNKTGNTKAQLALYVSLTRSLQKNPGPWGRGWLPFYARKPVQLCRNADVPEHPGLSLRPKARRLFSASSCTER